MLKRNESTGRDFYGVAQGRNETKRTLCCIEAKVENFDGVLEGRKAGNYKAAVLQRSESRDFDGVVEERKQLQKHRVAQDQKL